MKDQVVVFEYFDVDSGWRVGASRQTGWGAVVAKLIDQYAIFGTLSDVELTLPGSS